LQECDADIYADAIGRAETASCRPRPMSIVALSRGLRAAPSST
jgi:hypothetical protein